MISEIDIRDMYVLEEQPRPLGTLEKDSMFSIAGTPDKIFKLIAGDMEEVIVKAMELKTKYFSLPGCLQVHQYIWKH